MTVRDLCRWLSTDPASVEARFPANPAGVTSPSSPPTLCRRVAQLASSCVRSIRNLRLTFNCPNRLNLGIRVHSKFLVPAAPSFCEAGPPAVNRGFHRHGVGGELVCVADHSVSRLIIVPPTRGRWRRAAIDTDHARSLRTALQWSLATSALGVTRRDRPRAWRIEIDRTRPISDESGPVCLRRS